MTKDWRKGGKYPSVSFNVLSEMIDGNLYSIPDLHVIWKILVQVSQADSKVSRDINLLPPYYSFSEAVLMLYDTYLETGQPIHWINIPYLALNISTPKNWELF